MEKSQKAFEEWMTQETLAEDIKIDLARMKDKPEEIHEAFYKDLEFGTSGLRGIMGAGTNRMNRYVVKKVTQGLAEYLLQQEQKPRVAIGYDSRLNSIEFAQCTAGVLVANGIQVYMYRQLMPVAALSYGIRRLGCHMGVMITASHNPKEYNGYKVYGPTGCQILGEAPKEILRACEKVDLFHGVKSLPFAALDGGRGNENFSYIPKEIEEEYVEAAYQCGLDTKGLSKLNIVYTPLNGAGNKPVQEVLRRGGVKNLYLVPEQEEPDGNFETCPLPNPEFQEAYALGVALCKEVSGDFVLATDPDCDRVGVAIPQGETCFYPTGNHIGALLFDYICTKKKLPKNGVAVKSIVSTPMLDKIARENGIRIENTLIGFKYIGERIETLKERYVFGFEEGNGYLVGDYVRDKDGVSAALLIAEMMAFHKAQNRTIPAALEDLCLRYGYCKEKVIGFDFQGVQGVERMKALMAYLRENQRKDVLGERPIQIIDYLRGESYSLGCQQNCTMVAGTRPTNLPKSDILEFSFADETKVIIRPSGTEPKMKAYLFSCGSSREEAIKKIEQKEMKVREIIEYE